MRYILGIIVVAICAAVRSQLPAEALPYLFFIPGLMVTGFLFGTGPAIFSSVLSTLAAIYLFVGQPFTFNHSLPLWLNGISFGTVSAVMAVICSLFRKTLMALYASNEKLEEQVERRTRERDSIWDVSPDMICTLTSDGSLTAANPAWEKTLGWTPEELTAGKFNLLISQNALTEALSRLHAKATEKFVTQGRRKDGETTYLDWNFAKRAGTVYAVVRDVTAVTESQQQLEQAQVLLLQSQKMEAIGQLTGGIAHDFNNLLGAISGSHELLATRIRQGRYTDFERYLEIAQAATQRAAALTHRLLAYARRQPLVATSVDVPSLVHGMEELIRRTIGPQIEIRTVADADAWACFCDPHQLENALLNLCINARDAMPDGGILTLETANVWLDEENKSEPSIQAGRYVRISVTDTGTGMPAEIVKRAFDPFFTTKPIGSGTGLGLSMVHGFVNQSNGHAKIDSEVNAGTTVSLFLPRCTDSAGQPKPSLNPANLTPTGRREKILVVDDESAIRLVISDALSELNYHVIEARDGRSALQVLSSGTNVDLLITDVGLPGGMNGRQLAETARTLKPNLQVLFVTGYAENAMTAQETLQNGMRILTKPFTLDVLIKKVERMVKDVRER